MCYVMHIGAVEALKLRADRVPDREVPEEGARRADRHPVVLRPRDRLALLVPDRVRRPPCRRRLRGAEEGVVDDVGRVRRLLRLPDDLARLQRRLLEPVGVRGRQGRDRGEARRSGTRMGLRGNQSGSLLLDWKFVPEDQLVGPIGDGANSNDESVDPYFLIGSSGMLERHLAGRDRHRHPPHDPQDAQGRRPAGVRLPDDPGRRRRGDHGHQRLAHVRALGRAGAGRRSPTARRPTRPSASWRAATTCTGCGRSSSRRPRTWPTSSTRCSTAAAAPATRRSRSSSSATCATARPAG